VVAQLPSLDRPRGERCSGCHGGVGAHGGHGGSITGAPAVA
jgi:hypothetical protein